METILSNGKRIPPPPAFIHDPRAEIPRSSRPLSRVAPPAATNPSGGVMAGVRPIGGGAGPRGPRGKRK